MLIRLATSVLKNKQWISLVAKFYTMIELNVMMPEKLKLKNKIHCEFALKKMVILKKGNLSECIFFFLVG